ncbi:hypothetical protein LG296_01595 [Ureibacillus chungkukjangi]|uniref:hypothetical protein n=1 Tax=Ureibacillus chungkukjangi TaxID=1202712 RepID=UPI00384C4709
MTRTLQSQLIEKGLVNKVPKKQQSKQPKEQKPMKQHKTTKLSRRDLEELMGTKRPIYHKVKGSYRSR